MTGSPERGGPAVRVVHETSIPETPLNGAGSQRVLLGTPRGDDSPILVGVTRVNGGCTTELIEHDVAEFAYVVSGAGVLLTDRSEHPFGPGSALLIDARCWHAICADEREVVMLFGFPCPYLPATRRRGR